MPYTGAVVKLLERAVDEAKKRLAHRAEEAAEPESVEPSAYARARIARGETRQFKADRSQLFPVEE